VDWKLASAAHPQAVTVLGLFGDWNVALEQAGLGRVRVRRHNWSEQEILDALRNWRRVHGRVPYSTEWAHAAADHPSSQTVRSTFGRWDVALRAAGLSLPPRPERRSAAWTPDEVVETIRAWTAQNGRLPAGWEWLRAGPGHPAKSTVVERFGSWQAALTAAGAPLPGDSTRGETTEVCSSRALGPPPL
jgi:hypothetical protein